MKRHTRPTRAVRIWSEVVRFKCFYLCTHPCPYRLARLGTSRPKAKRLIVFSRRYAPKNTIRLPPCLGEADTKEERIHSFYYLNTLLTIIYAGFFAKRHMMFFLLSSFRFYSPLKNDGRGEFRFSTALNTCLVILERSEESRQKMQELNVILYKQNKK